MAWLWVVVAALVLRIMVALGFSHTRSGLLTQERRQGREDRFLLLLGRKQALARNNLTPRLYATTEEESEEDEECRIIKDPDFIKRNKHRVILVDDEESIRIAVGDYLYDQGYQVSACADADAFLDLCAKPNEDGELPELPDLIVSDIRMPGKNGLELLGWIREDERLQRVPVVLLTARTLTPDRIEGFNAGADAYLPKPFDPEELLAIIDNLIQRRKQMTSPGGKLSDLKSDMATIKQLLRRNRAKVVKATNVFLTGAEREVLELLCKGYTNAEIASERGVNVLGVNRMIQKLYSATQTSTRTELVRWAIKTGYVAPRERKR